MTYELPYHCLSLDEWITVTSVLTYSEVKVFYYLLASNPMGDRQIDCRIRTIAKALNISTGAVSTALKQLETKKLIESVEIVEAKITIKPKLISVQAQKYKDKVDKAKKSVQPTEQIVQSTENVVQPTENVVQPTENIVQPTEQANLLKTIPVGNFDDSSAPQTIQTYTDFRKTLSDEERESFLNFVREKIKDFSPQINDLEGWLAEKNKAGQNRWEVYYDLFRKSQPELVHRQQNAEWENHHSRNEWLTEIESTSNPAMFAGSDKEKQAFVSWCWKTKQFSWLKEEVEDGI